MRRVALLLPWLLVAGTACQRPTDRGTTVPPMTTITPDAPLRNTRWVLRQVGSQLLGETFQDGQEPFLFISGAGTAEGQSGCNRFRGSLKPVQNDAELQFAPLLSTRLACPALDTERAFTQALEATRAYRITGNVLMLYDNPTRSGEPVVRLEAVSLR